MTGPKPSATVPDASASDLWTRHAAGDPAARDQLLNEHLGLVFHVAKRMARRLGARAERAELVSAGTMGLMQAVDTFDATRGSSFSTFAAPRIRGAILDELRRLDPAPRSVRLKARRASAARETLANALGRAPTHEEIAAQLGVDGETLRRWEADVAAADPVPLHAPSGPDRDGAARGPMLADAVAVEEDGGSVEDVLAREQEAARLREALLRLPERQRTVLALYYYEELTLLEIATVLGRTESRVCQIRKQALAALGAALRVSPRKAA